MLDPACSQDSAKMPSGGEFDDESTAAACFNGVRWCAMHVLCAGSASERCMLSESAASACLSQPYDPIVWLREGLFASTMWPTRSICMILTAAVLTIVIVGTVACSVAKKLTILGYRHFFSLFGPSSRATGPCGCAGPRTPCPVSRCGSHPHVKLA